MSELTNMLELLENLVLKVMPDRPARMNKGLSLQEIEAEMKYFECKFPLEIYEIFQWHNGGEISFFPYPECYDLQFFSLDEATTEALHWNDNVFPDMNLLPLFTCEGVVYWTIGSEIQQDIAPIYCNDYLEIPNEPIAWSLKAILRKEIDNLRIKFKFDVKA